MQMLKISALTLLLTTFPTIAQTGQTRKIDIGDKSFRALAVSPDTVQLHWQDEQFQPYGSLARVKHMLQAQGKNVIALMNAGIYSTNNQPAGLHIEQGKTYHALNTRRGGGNFHMQPNGVFLITEKGRPAIVTSKAYQRDYHNKPLRVATQSGPMLLIDGEINSKFIPNSDSLYTRNGVCTTSEGKLFFVVTDNFLSSGSNFYQFAKAMQALGCNNGLYLDGSISKLYVDGENSTFHFSPFVGILSVAQ